MIFYSLFKTYANVFTPVYHSVLELTHLVYTNLDHIVKPIIICACSFALALSLGYYQLTIQCIKWIGLGILSSIGFGFGMHTFVLFLAPHIAAVTISAQSCQSLDFPSPPYPDEIVCPRDVAATVITFSDILQKVGLESFMWGLGTAIGELPPYLAARVRAQAVNSKISGDSQDQPESTAGWELWMIKIITKVGFIGILLCAAIPNPLFDAAGVASGIAQVPFLTFFGATFIGKAILKVLLQTSFVIFLFHGNKLDSLIHLIDERLGELIPSYKALDLYSKIAALLEDQRTRVLQKQIDDETKQTSTISTLFNWLILLITILFVISVINALDKQYRDRKASKTNRRSE